MTEQIQRIRAAVELRPYVDSAEGHRSAGLENARLLPIIEKLIEVVELQHGALEFYSSGTPWNYHYDRVDFEGNNLKTGDTAKNTLAKSAEILKGVGDGK
jgi:hypothetical protein